MSIQKLSSAQIRAIKAEDTKTWPMELTVWVENWKKDWPLPWFVPVSEEKAFVHIRLSKKKQHQHGLSDFYVCKW